MKKKIVVTIEARMTSSRLPGKILMLLAGKPSLEQMVNRIKRSSKVDEVIIATTTNEADDPVVELCEKIDCRYFRGDEHDVMKRVLGAAHAFKATHIVGLTGDCPLIDPGHIDQMIDFYFANDFNYVSNRLQKGLPDGFDVQVYSVADLELIERTTNDPIDRVHVTCFFYNNPDKFKIGSLAPKETDEEYWPELAVTLDEFSDYQFLNKIFEEASTSANFLSAKEVIKFLKRNPRLLDINSKVTRKQLSDG